jgi:hypothetical protein
MLLICASSLALLAVSGGQSAPTSGLADKPIAGSTITYIKSWTAVQSGRSPNGCDFQTNTDLKPAGGQDSGRMVSATDTASCCAHCWHEATCAASVFVPEGNQCWLKNRTDMAGGSYQRSGRTACVRKYGAPVSAPLRVGATVPGDLLTDLQRAGQIGDPLYEKNWLNSTLWNLYNWTYTSSFSLSDAALGRLSSGGGSARLVFEGIKMGARISVNGVAVGAAVDQFLR